MNSKQSDSIQQSLNRLLQLSGIENSEKDQYSADHEIDDTYQNYDNFEYDNEVHHETIDDLERELHSLRNDKIAIDYQNNHEDFIADPADDYFKDRRVVLRDLHQEDYDYGYPRDPLTPHSKFIYRAPKYRQEISHARHGSNPLSSTIEEDKAIFSNIKENDSKILETLSNLVSRSNDVSLFTGLHKIKTGMTKSINEEETKSIAIAFINLLKEDNSDSINSFYSYFKELEEKNLLGAYREHLNNIDIDVSDFIKMHGKHPEKIYESKRWAIDFGNKIEFFDGFFDEVKKSIMEYAEYHNYKGVIKVSP